MTGHPSAAASFDPHRECITMFQEARQNELPVAHAPGDDVSPPVQLKCLKANLRQRHRPPYPEGRIKRPIGLVTSEREGGTGRKDPSVGLQDDRPATRLPGDDPALAKS